MAVAALIRERQNRDVLPYLDAHPLEDARRSETGGLDALGDGHQLPLAHAGRAHQLEVRSEGDAERLADHAPAIRRGAHPAVDLALRADWQPEPASVVSAQLVPCKPGAGQSAE
jgi:hypothetical protein